MENVSDKGDFTDEIVDIEKYAAEGRRVPDCCKGYLISVNGQKHKVKKPVVTREEVAFMAKFDPAEEVCVRVSIHGESPRLLQKKEEIDLTKPGIEQFWVDKECIVKVKVNATTFQLAVPTTGERVKKAAIKAGAKIELDFVLFLETADGQAKQIDDAEVIYPNDGDKFSAVSGDDNS